MNWRRVLLLGVGAVSLLFILYVIYLYSALYFSDRRLAKLREENGRVAWDTKTTYQILMERNKDFSVADGYLKGRNGAKALESLERALAAARNKDEESQILYKISEAYSLEKEYLKAVEILKGIVMNLDYSAKVKAYSIYWMGQQFYLSQDQHVLDAIFAGEPFEYMYQEKDKWLALRRMYVECTNYRSIAPCEVRVALSLADDLINHPEYDQQTREKMLAEINDRLKKVGESLEYMKQDPNLAEMVMRTTILRANTLARLNHLGIKTEMNFEDDMKEARPRSFLSLSSEGSWRYFYAVNIALTDPKKRAKDIAELLLPLYASDQFRGLASADAIFRDQKKARIIGQEKYIELLAIVDPKFKSYLLENGWIFSK